MHKIYYKSSEGVIVNLIEAPYRMLSETDLLNNEWDIITVGENNPRIVKLKKKMVSPPFKIRVTGSSKDDMLNNLEHIEGVFDRDCFLNQMGRLYIGDFYRECFITATTHGKVFEKNNTVVQFVATSNNGLWTNDKNFALNGYGAPTGEIAYTVTPSARPNGEQLEWGVSADKKAFIKWNSGTYGSKKELRLDLGSEQTVGRFRGIHLTSSGTPLSCNVDTWDGESFTEVSDSIYLTNEEHTPRFPYYLYSDEIEIDHTVWNSLKVTLISNRSVTIYAIELIGTDSVGYTDRIRIYSNDMSRVGEVIDVSRYETVRFRAISRVSFTIPYPIITYKMIEEEWTTIDTYNVQNSTQEIDISDDFVARYIRLYSAKFLGIIEDYAVSIISGHEIRPRDLFGLGYTTENIEVIPYDDDSGRVNFKLIEEGKGGYLYFDAQSFILKKITSSPRSASSDGSITIWGENGGEWTLVLDLESDEPISEDFNTHYDRIRLAFSPLATNHLTQNFTVMAEADPVIHNESYAPSDAVIKLKGSWNNPQVSIGNLTYGANIELAEGQYLEIDTKNKTVRHYNGNDYENVFSTRLEESFERIETGENEVAWDGQHEIEVKLYQQRSIPKWN